MYNWLNQCDWLELTAGTFIFSHLTDAAEATVQSYLLFVQSMHIFITVIIFIMTHKVVLLVQSVGRDFFLLNKTFCFNKSTKHIFPVEDIPARSLLGLLAASKNSV